MKHEEHISSFTNLLKRDKGGVTYQRWYYEKRYGSVCDYSR